MLSLVKISVGEKVSVDVGGLRFEVVRRDVDDDGGTSIEVYADVEGDDTQVLRFDCFRQAPHYHMPPSVPGQLELDPAEVGDGLDWALECTRERLPEMLEKAGYPGVASRVDAAALRAGWTRVRDAAHSAPEPHHSYTIDPQA